MLLLVVVQVYIYTVQYYSAYVFPYNLSATYGAVILFISIVLVFKIYGRQLCIHPSHGLPTESCSHKMISGVKRELAQRPGSSPGRPGG